MRRSLRSCPLPIIPLSCQRNKEAKKKNRLISGYTRRGPRSSDCSFIFLLSDSAGASVVDQDECQKALDNLLNSFHDVMDLQAKVRLIFLVMLCN